MNWLVTYDVDLSVSPGRTVVVTETEEVYTPNVDEFGDTTVELLAAQILDFEQARGDWDSYPTDVRIVSYAGID